MTLALLVCIAIGAALGWAGVRWLQRARLRRLHCIAPYVPAEQRPAPLSPPP